MTAPQVSGDWPDYRDNDPRGWCGDPKRGAALGRYDKHAPDRFVAVKLRVSLVRIDSGGYDPNGTYFGSGEPLYWYRDASGAIDVMRRAPDRDECKRLIRFRYPKASFFR